jgi:hypothetical protein
MKTCDPASPITPAANELFAQKLAAGAMQSSAYRDCYPKSRRWLAKTVHETSSRLAKSHKVSARVVFLQNQSTVQTILSLEQRKVLLTKMALDQLPQGESVKTRDRLHAIDLLNKIEGLYAAKPATGGCFVLSDDPALKGAL